MNKLREFANKVWETKLVKEGVLLVATAAALTTAVELSKLLELIEDVNTVASAWDSFKVWFATFFNAVALTAIRQAIAYALARLGGNALDS